MGRHKEFDPDTVLDEAIAVFLEKGYAATSTADLVARLGIARGSLYATFGSKNELYLRALDRYTKEQFWTLFRSRPRRGHQLSGVRELVNSYAAEAAQGCFVLNAAVERMSDDTVARMVRSGWDNIEVTLTLALERAQEEGELSADADPTAIGRFLTVFLQGVRVVGRDEQNPERLADAVRTALKILD